MNIGIRPGANSIKMKRVVKPETSVLFPHNKIDEQPNKKPKKSHFPKIRENDDKNAVAIVKADAVLRERKFFGSAGLLWERQFEEVLLELGFEKGTNLGLYVCFLIENKDYSYRYTGMT